MSRWIWTCFLVVLVGGVLAYFQLAPGIQVTVAEATTGEIRTYVEEVAKTRLPNVHRVTMPLSGRIRPITLKEGDAVSAGSEVAQMDPVDLDTDLTEASARVKQFDQLLVSLVSTVKAAKARVKAAGAKLEFAQDDMRRKSELKKGNAISDIEIRKAELLEIESRIDLEQDSLTVMAIDAIRTAMIIGREDANEQSKRRQRDRKRASLISPIDGVVLRRRISSERVLPAGEVLLEIGKLEEMEIEAEILTQDAVKIREGDDVDIEGAAIGSKPIRGRVAQIFPRGFKKVSSLGVEQQRVLVIVRFDPQDLKRLQESGRTLGVDFRLRVKIYTARKNGALKIPRSAMFRSPSGSWQAFAVRSGLARRVDLEVGLMNDYEVEILSGVEELERVIVAPEVSVVDGIRVEARTD